MSTVAAHRLPSQSHRLLRRTLVAAHPPSLIVTDVVMSGMDGVAMAKIVRMSYPNCRVLLFSGNAETEDLLALAEDEGYVFEILAKPVPPLYMLAKVASLLDQSSSSQ